MGSQRVGHKWAIFSIYSLLAFSGITLSFFFFFSIWSLLDLQYCVSFRCTAWAHFFTWSLVCFKARNWNLFLPRNAYISHLIFLVIGKYDKFFTFLLIKVIYSLFSSIILPLNFVSFEICDIWIKPTFLSSKLNTKFAPLFPLITKVIRSKITQNTSSWGKCCL